MVLWESDGKYSHFDEIWQTRHFWEQTGPAKKKGSANIRICRIHRLHLISGKGFLVLRESDGKYSLFDEIWQTFLGINWSSEEKRIGNYQNL